MTSKLLVALVATAATWPALSLAMRKAKPSCPSDGSSASQRPGCGCGAKAARCQVVPSVV